MAALNQQNRNDPLEIIEGGHGNGATFITSQPPTNHWHDAIGEATLADAILDQLLHSAHKIQLEGESMRKIRCSGLQKYATNVQGIVRVFGQLP